MRIVLLQQNLLGDVIVTTPLLRQIRIAAPTAHIALVLGPLNQAVRPLLGDLVDEVIDYAKKPLPLAKIWWQTKRPRFDWLIDLAEAHLKSSRLLVKLMGAKRSVGFANGNVGLYDVTLPLLPQSSTHIVDRYLTALKPLNLPPPADPHIDLSLSREMSDWAKQVWPATSRPGVLVNISGTGPTKAWGTDNYLAFIDAARQSHPQLRFVLTGHQRDEAEMNAISAKANVPRLPLTPKFEQFAAIIREADYIVTPETSVLHLAAAWQRPCLGLYVQRPQGDNWTPYRSPNEKLLSPTLSVADITVDQVLQGFNKLVSGVGSLSPRA